MSTISRFPCSHGLCSHLSLYHWRVSSYGRRIRRVCDVPYKRSGNMPVGGLRTVNSYERFTQSGRCGDVCFRMESITGEVDERPCVLAVRPFAFFYSLQQPVFLRYSGGHCAAIHHNGRKDVEAQSRGLILPQGMDFDVPGRTVLLNIPREQEDGLPRHAAIVKVEIHPPHDSTVADCGGMICELAYRGRGQVVREWLLCWSWQGRGAAPSLDQASE